MLNQERVNQMDTLVSLGNTSSDTFKSVLNIIHLANNYFHYLNTSNACNVPKKKHGNHADQKPHHILICFNCGEPHMLPDCKRPRNEAKIARNRKGYMENHPDGPPCNGGRKKWTKLGRGDVPDRSHGSGAQLMGNKWMWFFNGTACGWNLTHTSEFHAAWLNETSKLSLPTTHKFRIKYGTANVTSSKGETATDSLSARSSLYWYFIGHAGDLAQKNEENNKAMLDHYKINADDSDLSNFVADLKTAWGLN